MMTNTFSAAEARMLSGETVEEKVNSLLDAIKEAATKGKRELRTSWEYHKDDDLWVNGGYPQSADWKEAVEKLTGRGFEVSFYYQESQFVDMYTLVKW